MTRKIQNPLLKNIKLRCFKAGDIYIMDKDSNVINRLDSWLSPVINSMMTYKGQRESMTDLPKTDNRLGDVYYVVSEGKQYAYNGMSWELIDDTHGDGGQSLINYKGVKDTVAELPADGNETGDAWYVTEDSSMYMWNGTSWDSLGEVTPPSTDVSWDDIKDKPDVFYVHPTSPAGAKQSGLYKIATDEDGHVVEATPVTMVDVSSVYVDDVDAGSADGRVVPNLNVVKKMLEDSGMSPDDAMQVAQQAMEIANRANQSAINAQTTADEALEATKNMTKISGGYGPPAIGGNAGDIYIDYETGDIYEFGNDGTE